MLKYNLVRFFCTLAIWFWERSCEEDSFPFFSSMIDRNIARKFDVICIWWWISIPLTSIDFSFEILNIEIIRYYDSTLITCFIGLLIKTVHGW